MVGWTLFGLLLVWHVMTRLHSAKKRLHLTTYTIMLLLREGIAQDHRAKFQEWVKQSGATDTNALFTRASGVVQTMANGMANNQDGPSLLAVQSWLSDCQRGTHEAR